MKTQILKKLILLFSLGLILSSIQVFGGSLTFDNQTSYEIHLKNVPIVVGNRTSIGGASFDHIKETTPVGPGQKGGSEDMSGAFTGRSVGYEGGPGGEPMPTTLVVTKEGQSQEFEIDLSITDVQSKTLNNGCKIKVTVARDGHQDVRKGLYWYKNVAVTLKEDCTKDQSK